jgi:hypothetical protein
MRLKFSVIFVVLFLSFGYANAVGTNATLGSVKIVSEIAINGFEANKAKTIELYLENGSTVNCSFQAKNSSFQNVGNGKLAVSINSNWICR